MKKILVIEDDPNVRNNIYELLINEDFEVYTKENGKLGYEEAIRLIPDLIISDVMMPEMNGYQVIESLRKNPMTAAIPFIFLSAKADKINIRDGMNFGADDYLTKPFTADELLNAINSRLERKYLYDKKIDELRQNLSMSLPHELRTPLTGMMGFAQLMKDNADFFKPEEIKQMSEKIYYSGQRLHRLIQNYLIYSELMIIESGTKSFLDGLNEITVSPDSLLNNIANAIAERYDRKADLSLKLVDRSIKIKEEHFVKIIEEIVDNSFKFSTSGSLVEITSNYSTNYYSLSIKDFGIGMDKEEVTSIGAFMQFNRKYNEQQGSGLGLTIAYKLAKLYNASVSIQSGKNNFTIIKIDFLTA